MGDVKIAFSGSEEYRLSLQTAALARKIKVQTLIERAIAAYLTEGEKPAPGPQLVVRPESMKRLEAVARHRHAELHELLNMAVDDWLDGAAKEKPSLVPTGPNFRRTKHPEAHELLEVIMTEGNPNDVGWITGNLVNFVEAIRSRKSKAAKRA